MDDAVKLIGQFGLFAVFLTVLLDEGGLPLPASPLLAVAGALTARGDLSLAWLVAAAVAGSFVADNGWYWLGRRRGRRVLGLLCKLSLSPDSCVRQTESLFARVGPSALLFAKFVPALGNVTIALAGITRVPFAVFLPLEIAGATIYLGTEIVVYCACPNEASAAIAAKHLRAAGFRRIRPLLGGIDAWAQAGYALVVTDDDEKGAVA